MTRRSIIRGSAVYAGLIAVGVVTLANYYENIGLLAMQLALIGGPSFAPFLVFGSQPSAPRWMVAAVGLVIGAGWAGVIYIDTRPYEGGGASFAILLGWMSCVVAALFALLMIGAHAVMRARRRREDDRPR